MEPPLRARAARRHGARGRHGAGARLTETLIAELRRAGESALAEQIDKAQYGSTGSEILGDIGAALLGHPEARARLGPEGQRAWDSLVRQVNKAFPGWSFRTRLARLWPWRKA